MYLIRRSKVAALVLVLVMIVSQACGGAISPRSVIAGAPTLINFLVSKGKLKPETGERLKVDFNDGAQCALVLEEALDQIAKTDPDARSKKREAWLAGAQCWRPIVLRQNFAAEPQVQNVASLISALFDTGIRFFTDSKAMRVAIDGAVITEAEAEKKFEKDMEKRLKELKEAMKP